MSDQSKVCAETCGPSWHSSMSDLWGGLSIALVILAAGYAGCEDSTLRARGKLITECRKLMVDKQPIPEMCTAAVK